MLKMNVDYTTFGGEHRSRELYFHLSKSDMLDVLRAEPNLMERMEALDKLIKAPNRTLSEIEILELLDIFKIFVAYSYGERDEKEDTFVKDADAFKRFRYSPAYDAFILDMFVHTEKANDFIEKIMPEGLDEFAKEVDAESARMQAANPTAVQASTVSPIEEVPAYITENREPTRDELAAMTPAQLQEAFRRKSSQ